MKVLIIENQSKKQIGELTLKTQPQSGEYIEFDSILYSIHNVIHSNNNLKLIVIPVR